MPDIILYAKQIVKGFIQPDKTWLQVLDGLSLEVERNAITAITGASGSGKSTLLHLLGALDLPDQGDITVAGENILSLKGKRRAEYRNRTIGFIFQFHYLMPELSVLENVAFPALLYDFKQKPAAYDRAAELLAAVGLKDKVFHLPFQLSGGERQRVAIARSLINSPALLLADEPTGNLDWQTGEKVFHLFKDLIKEHRLTAVMATHNEQLAGWADRKYHLQAGKLAPPTD